MNANDINFHSPVALDPDRFLTAIFLVFFSYCLPVHSQTFEKYQLRSTYNRVYDLTIGDGDNDGEPELYAASGWQVYQIEDDLTADTLYWDNYVNSLAVGDYDIGALTHDGTHELYLAGDDGDLSVMLWNGNTGYWDFKWSRGTTGSEAVKKVVHGNLDSDEFIEWCVVWYSQTSKRWELEFIWNLKSGDEHDPWMSHTFDTDSWNLVDCFIADLDGQPGNEVYIAFYGDALYRCIPDYTPDPYGIAHWQVTRYEQIVPRGYGMGVGDVDRDGRDEIYYIDQMGPGYPVVKAEWDGNALAPCDTLPAPAGGWRGFDLVCVGDADNDCNLEVYAAHANQTLYYYRPHAGPSGNWIQSTVGTMEGASESARVITIGDADADGANELYAGTYYLNEENQIRGHIYRFEMDETLFPRILSFNTRHFPFVFARIAVDHFICGTAAPDYSIEVFENRTWQTSYLAVRGPGEKQRACVIFIVDNSGSMSNYAPGLEDHAEALLDSMAARGFELYLGLCRFGSEEGDGAAFIENNAVLSNSAGTFMTSIWSRNRYLESSEVAGIKEAGWDALITAARGFDLDPETQKLFILLTDETPTGDNNIASYSRDNALTLLQNRNIRLFAHLDLSDVHASTDYGEIAAGTGGLCADLADPFDRILDALTWNEPNIYSIQYKSSRPEIDGTERFVDYGVSYQGRTVVCDTSYLPSSAPHIQIAQSTLDLSLQAWLEGEPLSIEAEVVDYIAPYLQSGQVMLHYRVTGDEQYIPMEMEALNPGSQYGGPFVRVLTGASHPGMDYYISATDGSGTRTEPEHNPAGRPHQIAILPNHPPQILHTPLLSLTPNTALTIAAEVTDETNYLDAVELYYRKPGAMLHTVVNMSSTGGDTYEGTIPAAQVTGEGLQYYIRAKDDFGIAVRYPQTDVEVYPILDYTANNQTFQMDADAWGFDNVEAHLWPAGSGEFPTLELFKKAFDVSYISDLAFDASSEYAYYQLVKRAWHPITISAPQRWKGSCYGLAYTCQLFKEGYNDLFDLTWLPSYTFNINDITDLSKNPAGRDYVNVYYLHQFGAVQLSHILARSLMGDDYGALISQLRTALSNGTTIGLAEYFTTGGHIITPIRLQKINHNPETYKVTVYDNADHTRSYDLEIDATNNSWVYDGPLNYLTPTNLEPGLQTRIETFSPVIPTVESYLGFRVDLVVSGIGQEKEILFKAGGEELGFKDGQTVDNFSRGTPFYPLVSAIDYGRPPGYLFDNRSVSCTILNTDDSDYDFFLFRCGQAYHFTKSAVSAETRDVLEFDEQRLGYTLHTTSEDLQTLTSRLIRVNESEQESVLLSQIRLNRADTLDVRIEDDSEDGKDDLVVANLGRSQIVSLELCCIQNGSYQKFERSGVELKARALYRFTPDWANMGDRLLIVEVDTDLDGTMDETLKLENQYTGVETSESSGAEPPAAYALSQNYPNPFNNRTKIRFALPEPSQVRIELFNVLGQQVRVLLERRLEAGYHEMAFEAADLASGLYLCRFRAHGFVRVRKMVLMR